MSYIFHFHVPCRYAITIFLTNQYRIAWCTRFCILFFIWHERKQMDSYTASKGAPDAAKLQPDGEGQENHRLQQNNGSIPHWCRNPSPVVTSNNSTTSTASWPFQVSTLFVQPHSHTITGGGSSSRFESYAASSSSTLPRGTSDCRMQNHRPYFKILSRLGYFSKGVMWAKWCQTLR